MYQKSEQSSVPTPIQVAERERIFERFGMIRDVDDTHSQLGHCTIGSSLSGILRDPIPSGLPELFQQEQYLIWFDQRCLRRGSGSGKKTETPYSAGVRRIHICLKEGYTPSDQFKAWVHAVEVCRLGFRIHGSANLDGAVALDVIRTAYDAVAVHIADFTSKLQSAGWNPGDYALMTGSPAAVVTLVVSTAIDVKEDKKSQ